jgi:hypothetical protein
MREINDRRPWSAAAKASSPSPPTASAARCAIQPVSATRTMHTAKATKRIPIPAVMNRFSMPQSAATSSVDDAAIKTRAAVSAHMQCRAGKGPRSSTLFGQEKRGSVIDPETFSHFRSGDLSQGAAPHRQKQRSPLELARRIRRALPGCTARPATGPNVIRRPSRQVRHRASCSWRLDRSRPSPCRPHPA